MKPGWKTVEMGGFKAFLVLVDQLVDKTMNKYCVFIQLVELDIESRLPIKRYYLSLTKLNLL